MTERWAEHLRPRSPYEAIDFGFLFVREQYAQLFFLAATSVLPLAVLLPFVVPGGALGASVVIWWLKPLWERPLLHHLSRSLFEAPPPWRATWAAWRSWATRDLLAFLTWRRVSPTRSFDQPITLLEGSTGRERAARLSILHRGRFPGAAVALTLLIAHVEVFIQLGLLVLIAMLIPETLDVEFLSWLLDLEGEADDGAATAALEHGLLVLAFLLTAPFYTGAGFSLYLHRRTELEAWDLEVAFRRLADRLRARRSGFAPAARGLGLALLVVGATWPSDGSATPLGREEARVAIERVLEAEDFHAFETLSIPHFVADLELEEDEASELPEWLTGLFDALAGGFAGSVQVLAVALILLALGWLALRFVSAPSAAVLARRDGRPRLPVPRVLFGMEITQESLPEDPASQALAWLRAGRTRAALALLYRAALSRLVLHHGADLSRGVTEGECLRIAAALLPEASARYFASLTTIWLRCAYGHLEPETGELERLCREWESGFSGSDGFEETAR